MLSKADENGDNNLAKLKRKIKETIEIGRLVYFGPHRISFSNFEKFETLLNQVTNILNEMKNETEIALLASVKMS